MKDKEDLSKMEILPPPEAMHDRSVNISLKETISRDFSPSLLKQSNPKTLDDADEPKIMYTRILI
jgi:hypothetical protein